MLEPRLSSPVCVSAEEGFILALWSSNNLLLIKSSCIRSSSVILNDDGSSATAVYGPSLQHQRPTHTCSCVTGPGVVGSLWQIYDLYAAGKGRAMRTLCVLFTSRPPQRKRWEQVGAHLHPCHAQMLSEYETSEVCRIYRIRIISLIKVKHK